ncbi:hypothetical protein M0804_002041 [Polistes exclamans]|nr:hypothetical protein M0804_002041 [Polistes exclamans]
MVEEQEGREGGRGGRERRGQRLRVEGGGVGLRKEKKRKEKKRKERLVETMEMIRGNYSARVERALYNPQAKSVLGYYTTHYCAHGDFSQDTNKEAAVWCSRISFGFLEEDDASSMFSLSPCDGPLDANPDASLAPSALLASRHSRYVNA